MSLSAPTEDELTAVANELGLPITHSDLKIFHSIISQRLKRFDQLLALGEEHLEWTAPARHYHWPSVAENPYGAWFCRSRIQTAADGPLAGLSVTIKDNIAVAGLPMLDGLPAEELTLSNEDATVVRRLLAAGATIAGKTHCEMLCCSSGSHTSASGPVLNPRNPRHMTGGSSSGSAAAVAAGDVDIAIGTDQAGSCRIPAAACGVIGIKPTYGLIPYTGALGSELTIDHLGILSRSVVANAKTLSAVAGADGLDSRQSGQVSSDYARAIDEPLPGLRIARLAEGFSLPGQDDRIGPIVQRAIDWLQTFGHTLVETSVPEHRQAPVIYSGVFYEGAVRRWRGGLGTFPSGRGRYLTALPEAFSLRNPGELAETVQLALLMGSYIIRRYPGKLYGTAQNLIPWLTRAYDEQFERFHLLAMPTITNLPPEFPLGNVDTQRSLEIGHGNIGNTVPFNLTGHPAISIPCGTLDGLPVGLMLVAPKNEEALLYRVARIFEQENPDTRTWLSN